MWKEKVVSFFEELSQNFPEKAEKMYENESGYPVRGLRFELEISLIYA
jgi:hypothetical protein